MLGHRVPQKHDVQKQIRQVALLPVVLCAVSQYRLTGRVRDAYHVSQAHEKTIRLGNAFREVELAVLPRESQVVPLFHEGYHPAHPSLPRDPETVCDEVHAPLEYVFWGFLEVHVACHFQYMLVPLVTADRLFAITVRAEVVKSIGTTSSDDVGPLVNEICVW